MADTAKRTENDLSSLEARLHAPLTSEVRDLFQRAEGEEGPLRLMTPTEVARTHEAIQQVGVRLRGCCAFWTDDNSNYAALYLSGPLSGKVCFLDHEEPDLSPVYRSLSSFLAAQRLASKDGKDWYEMPTDYPTPTDYYYHQSGKPLAATEMELGGDLEIVKQLRSLLDGLSSTEDDERRYLCFCIIGLTPPENLDLILEFLRDQDMWVQERAADVLGFRLYEPAIKGLSDLAFSGTGNGISAAMKALGRIGTVECREALLKCVESRAAGYAPFLASGLTACGCETTHDRGKWRFRLPGEMNWKTIN